MIQIYLPSILIVIISWVSFWFSRDATPARVSLGVTTVLTMTTLMTTTNAQMPKVSYIKSIDTYLGVCFIMVFASLLEYAAVGYLNKKLRMRREKTMKKGQRGSSTSTPKKGHGMQLPAFLKVMTSDHSNSHQQVSPGVGQLSSSYLQGGVECDCDIDDEGGPIAHPLRIAKPLKPKRRGGFRSLTPSMIDKYSRIIFPVLFAIFNVVYWIVLWRLSTRQLAGYTKAKDRVNGSTPETEQCFKDPKIFTGVFVPSGQEL